MRERRDDMKQVTAGRNGTLDCCSKEGTSMHVTHALPTELLRHSLSFIF